MIGIAPPGRKLLFFRLMTTPIPLILASTSPHRRALLERLQLPFRCVAPGVEEDELPGEPPPVRAARLALAKAQAVALIHPGAIVIGSDQVASIEGGNGLRVLHKPGNSENCRRQLLELSGRRARFDTALAVIGAGKVQTHADVTQVQFRHLDAATIERYVEREPSFDCAGGFKCEGLGVTLFESIESRDPTALVGLPLIAVCAALRRLGVPA
jgi:septum formation protein